jgi:hypothetical protein
VRWFILILISANVALFFWLQYEELPEEPVLALPPPDVGRLELLREPSLVEQRMMGAADDAPADDPLSRIMPAEALAAPVEWPGGGDPASPGPADQGGAAEPIASAAPVSESLPEVTAITGFEPLPGSDVESVVANSLAEVDPAGAEPVLESTEVPPGERLQALAEVPVDEPQTEISAEAPEPAPAQKTVEIDPVIVEQAQDEADGKSVAPPPAVASCARVGPLSPEDADGLIGALPVFIELLSDVTEEIVEVRGYYVMIPPLPSRAEGLRVLEELESAGITDTWLFPRGVYRHAISLGLFNRQAGALRRQQRVVKAGFDAEVVDRSSRREVRQLLLKNVDGGDIALSLPLPDGASAEPLSCP